MVVTAKDTVEDAGSVGDEGTVAARAAAIHGRLGELAQAFGAERAVRQRRRELDPRDFERLRDAGFLLTGVPAAFGGVWEDPARSTRPIAEMLRTLAHGDSSVALVASMHPSVIATGGWLTLDEAPQPYREAWEAQRRAVLETVLDGAWWGTIVSEPGSGGDSGASKAPALLDRAPLGYRITGKKHFGSGAGLASYMITMAVPEGEDAPDVFFMDMRGVPWDGSAGVSLLAPWDGHGMIATQSHALEFRDFPATRDAVPAKDRQTLASSGGFVVCTWAAVMVGIVETAVAEARRALERRRGSLRPFELVEWERVQVDAWLVEQAYEGMLRAVERTGRGVRESLHGKVAIAELAESALGRLCRVIGGGAYSRTSPFGFWFEDVRALGYLRPPWALMFDQLIDSSWDGGAPAR